MYTVQEGLNLVNFLQQHAPVWIFEDEFAQFEISQHDAVLVAVMDSRGDLTEESTRFRLA